MGPSTAKRIGKLVFWALVLGPLLLAARIEDSSIIFLAMFVVAVTGATATTLIRLLRYRRADESPPLLLWRDIIARLGLAIPFGAIFAARTARELGVDTAGLINSPWWIWGTSLPAVVGAVVYLYFELFVIEEKRRTELGELIVGMTRQAAISADDAKAARLAAQRTIGEIISARESLHEIGIQVNGRLSALLDLTEKLARAEGVVEGRRLEALDEGPTGESTP